MSKFPATIVFTPEETVSVNHANVEPMSIVTHSSMEITLANNAFLVCFIIKHSLI